MIHRELSREVLEGLHEYRTLLRYEVWVELINCDALAGIKTGRE